MSRQSTDNLYIELGYFTPEEYYVYSAEARLDSGYYIEPDYIELNYYEDPAGNTRFALTCELTEVEGQVVEATGAFESVVSLSASAERSRSVDSTITSAFTTTAIIGKLQDSVIACEALFTPSLTVEVTKNSTAVLDTTATLESTVSKFTGYESLQEFIAALNAQAAKTVEVDFAQSAQFSVDASTARTRDTASSLAVSTSVTADGSIINIVDAEANITAQFSQTTFPIIYALRPRPNLYSRPNNNLTKRIISGVNPTVVSVNSGTDFIANSNYTFSNLQGDFSWRFANSSTGEHLNGTFPNLNIASNDFHFSFFYFRNQGSVIHNVNERFIARLGGNAPLVETLGSTRLEWRTTDPIVLTLVRTGNLTTPTLRLRVNNTNIIEGGSFNSGRITVQKVGTVVTLFVNGSNRGSLNLAVGLEQINQIQFQPQQGSSGINPIIDDAILKLGTTSHADGIQTNDDFTVFHYRFEQTLLDNFDTTITHIGASTMSTATTLIAGIGGLSNAVSNLEGTATITVNAEKVITAFAELINEFTQNALVSKLQDVEASLTSAGTLTVEGVKLVEAAATISSAFSQTTINSRTRDVDTEFESIATQISAVGRVGQGFITIDSVASVSASAEKVAVASSTLESTAEFNSSADRTRSDDASLSSEFAFTASIDKFVGFASAQTSTASVETLANKFTGFASAQTSEFALTASVDKFSGNQIVISSEFAVTAQGERIRFADSAQVSEFTVFADTIKSTTAEAALESSAELSATALRIQSGTISTDSVATQLVAVAKIGDFLITIDTVASLSADASVTSGSIATALSEFNLVADNLRVRFSDSTQNATTALSVSGTLATDSTVAFASETQLSVSSTRSAALSADLQTTGNLSAISLRILDFSADLEAFNSVLSVIDKFAENQVDMLVESALVASADRSRDNNISATASADLTSSGERVRYNSADLDSAASVEVAISRTKQFEITLSGAMQFESTVVAQKNGEILIQTAASLDASAEIIRGVSVALSSVSAQTASATRQRNTSASITSTATITATVRLFVLLEEYVFVIPRERRSFTIPRETRTSAISKENREFIIRG